MMGLSKELGPTRRPQSIVSCSAGCPTKQGDAKPGVLGPACAEQTAQGYETQEALGLSCVLWGCLSAVVS